MAEEKKEEKSNSDLQWEQFSDIAAERDDIELPDDNLGSGDQLVSGSLSQRMAYSPKLTDAQAMLKTLFPSTGVEWLDRLQMSEIFPDNYNYLFRIFVRSLKKKMGNKMTLAEAIATVHTACSIALTREGRIDVLALSGAISSASAAEEKKNSAIL